MDSGQATKGRDPDLIASRGQCDHVTFCELPKGHEGPCAPTLVEQLKSTHPGGSSELDGCEVYLYAIEPAMAARLDVLISGQAGKQLVERLLPCYVAMSKAL